MKHYLRLYVVMMAAVLLLSTEVWAQSALKVGVFDLQKFQQKSSVFMKRKDAMEKKFQSQRQKVEQERATLNKLETDFQKQRSILKQDAIIDKIVEIEAKRRYVKFLMEDHNETVKVADMEAGNQIEGELGEIIRNFAKQGGYTIIYERKVPGLLYVDSSLDITDKIIELFDKQVKP